MLPEHEMLRHWSKAASTANKFKSPTTFTSKHRKQMIAQQKHHTTVKTPIKYPGGSIPIKKTKTDLEVVNPERFEKLELVSLFFYFCACVCFAFLGLLTFGLSLSRFGGVWPFPVLPDLNISHTIAVCPGPPATLT
jgi:hypothetical protein